MEVREGGEKRGVSGELRRRLPGVPEVLATRSGNRRAGAARRCQVSGSWWKAQPARPSGERRTESLAVLSKTARTWGINGLANWPFCFLCIVISKIK